MSRMRECIEGVKRRYHRIATPLSDRSKSYYILNILAECLLAFFLVSAVMMRVHDVRFTENAAFVEAQSIGLFIMMIAAVAGILFSLTLVVSAERVLPAATILSILAFCGCLPDGSNRDVWLGFGMAVVCLIASLWIYNRFQTPFAEYRFGYGFAKAAVSVLFLIFVLFMSASCIARYLSFTYDTFDFGIFMQMFTYMKETGLPYTTVERNVQLSHFAVHFSPFFYVLLPGYMLFSSPIYLIVMQVLCVALGVFAVFGIARHLDFSPKATLLISAIYLMYPALSYGLFFDFHENKFLTVCILFTIYFMLKKQYIPFYISALLLCSVKEDAAIYLVAIALFMLFHERRIKYGVITLCVALAYFVFALYMIGVCGATEEAQFGYRYSNFELNGDSGIGSVIISILMNFGYAFTQIFQQDKFEFVLWMFLPVFFTPFMNKKISVLVLLLPMLLVNMLSNWIYQYDVDYQYTYGTAALIIVCSIFAIGSLPPRAKKIVLTAAVMTCFLITVPRTITRGTNFIRGYWGRQEMFLNSITFLDENLDKYAVIGVEGNVMPILYDCPYMYLDPHNDELAAKIEYYVTKAEDDDRVELTDRGFELYAEDGYIQIYKNPNYVPAEFGK